MHELAELPHEGLMTINQRLGLIAVLVEPGGRHRRLDLLHRLLALGDSRFEVRDAGLGVLRRLLAFTLLRRLALALCVIGRWVIFLDAR